MASGDPFSFNYDCLYDATTLLRTLLEAYTVLDRAAVNKDQRKELARAKRELKKRMAKAVESL